ncbi:hypothetical protein CCUS01_12925 [Colletotrichum cuscutae]|uniref:Uncharacterized protein n=1 Tax=Colletotrichum cuscutae TaxID=1209917 RepID=A0AAI9YD11_9PEZI|nr:hypothetical protein CCUS01_12925 [Colletotrichum cuscutae]
MIGDVTRRAAWEAQTRKLGEIPNATRAVEVSLRCTSHAVLVSVVSLGVSKFQVPYCYSQVYCCRIVQTRDLVCSRAVHLSVCWSALPGYSSLLPELSLTQSTITTENLGDVGRGHGWTCHIWAVVGFPSTGAILSVF